MVWYEGWNTGDRRFLLADERGSIVSVTNGSGQVMATNTYDEYGLPGSGNLGRFQYTGQAWIPELGLYHYKARAYSPSLGRFMQTDPSGYGDGLNLYAYVHNDPVNGIDPSGLQQAPPPDQTPPPVTVIWLTILVQAVDTGDNNGANCGDGQDCSDGDEGWGSAFGQQPGFGDNSFNATSHYTSVSIGGYGFGARGTAAAPQNALQQNNNGCSASDPQVVRNAALAALGHLNPQQNEANNVRPLNDNFARVVSPAAISTSGWHSAFSTHATAVESPKIPGQSTFAVKMYHDPSLGNTIAVDYPTDSLMHVVLWPLFQAGVNVNAAVARSYLGCPLIGGH